MQGQQPDGKDRHPYKWRATVNELIWKSDQSIDGDMHTPNSFWIWSVYRSVPFVSFSFLLTHYVLNFNSFSICKFQWNPFPIPNGNVNELNLLMCNSAIIVFTVCSFCWISEVDSENRSIDSHASRNQHTYGLKLSVQYMYSSAWSIAHALIISRFQRKLATWSDFRVCVRASVWLYFTRRDINSMKISNNNTHWHTTSFWKLTNALWKCDWAHCLDGRWSICFV